MILNALNNVPDLKVTMVARLAELGLGSVNFAAATVDQFLNHGAILVVIDQPKGSKFVYMRRIK